jgi:hypothetical protein
MKKYQTDELQEMIDWDNIWYFFGGVGSNKFKY